ncbi:hypothetical protein ACFL9T_21545 [Thermodesulfobacteriota bacterium]
MGLRLNWYDYCLLREFNEILRRAFYRFITTKEVGLGTGVDLSLTEQIVQRNGGAIQVSSGVGEGTEAKLAFPIKGATGMN